MIILRSVLLRMRNISDKSCRENRNTHFMFNKFFVLENLDIYEIMWKNIRTRRAADYTMAHGYCMLDTQVYRHTLRICHTSCFSAAKVVA